MVSLILVLAAIPILQWFSGQIYFFGVAWVNCLYLTGLALAVFLGADWEKRAPGQGADFLCDALIIAGIVSTGMLWYQWLGLGTLDLVINRSTGRPGANLGQPNQQASLLLLGLVAIAWSLLRSRVRAWVAVLFSIFVLTGVALTLSRAAWVNLCILLVSLFVLGILRKSRLTVWTALVLGAFFIACCAVQPWLASQLFVDGESALEGRFLAGQRPAAWAMFVQAVGRHPLWGYGWGQVGFAHLELADTQPAFGSVFENAHNILLDLLLWNGVPIGISLILFCAYWCILAAKRIRDAENFSLALGIVVLGLHAMLEYPLHYAYFLLPFGLLVGILGERLGMKGGGGLRPELAFLPWLVACLALVVTVRDYAKVEISFSDLRFEKARIHTDTPGGPPDTWVLTHLRELIVLGRLEPLQKMDEEELEWMRVLTKLYPSPLNAFNLSKALAFNQRNDEAQRWLKKMCRAFPQNVCDSARVNWHLESRRTMEIAATPWPDGY